MNQSEYQTEKCSNFQFYFLLFVLLGFFVLVFFIFRPFLYALVLALIFATVFYPLYYRIKSLLGGKQQMAALLTTFLFVVFVLTPLIFISVQIFEEAYQLYSSLVFEGGKENIISVIKELLVSFQSYIPGIEGFSLEIKEYLKEGLSWLFQNLGVFFSGLARMLLSVFVFLVSFYYLLKDGEKLKKFIFKLIPLSGGDKQLISEKLKAAVNSVVKGSLLIAVIQGFLSSVGFAVFGVPNPVLWGALAAIGALIPGVGTTIVLIPAIIFLFFTEGIFPAAGLSVWGVGAVGLVDNFLGPRLVGHGTKLHPLIVFLAVFGGIAFFGPLGILLGPLVLSLFFVLLEVYFSVFEKEKLSKNK